MTARRLMTIFMLVFLSLPLAAANSGTKEDSLLSPGQAGQLKLGMSIDEVYGRYGRGNTRLLDLYPEGMFNPALAVYLDKTRRGRPGLVAEIGWKDNWIVSRLFVYDPRFKTKEGIGVGSSLGELRKFYPVKEIVWIEGDVVAVVDKFNISFGLDTKSIPPRLPSSEDRHLIPATTKIVNVILY